MDGSLKWQLTDEAGVTRAFLAGEITEDSDFTTLLAELSTQSVVLDLSEIRRINSCGVREWINFVNSLDRNATAFVLERCSVPIVNQLNMISNFSGKGRVGSIFAPYFCPQCDKERARLIDLASPDVRIQEVVPCPTCGADMEFDDVPDRFLSFVAT